MEYFPPSPTPSFPFQASGWGNESAYDHKFNRFVNLESLEDRIIFYLLSPLGKTEEQLVQVHNLWKCIYYASDDALLHGFDLYKNGMPYIEDSGEHKGIGATRPLSDRQIKRNNNEDYEFETVDELTFFKEGIIPLISNTQQGQDRKRIFRSPYMDDAWKEECALLKIYIDSVIPMNAYLSQVNVGIDCVCHNKIINLIVPDCEKDESMFLADIAGTKYYVETKSRISVMIKAVLSLLNGANIQGIGEMQFNYEKFMYNESRYALWNNRNFEGQKIAIGCQIGGVA